MFSFSFHFFSGLVAVATLVSASSSPLSRRVLHERRSTVPHGWQLHKRADPDALLPLSIALRQSNIDNLEEYLLSVSDPESPNYGQHWTPARVAKTFRPSEQTVEVVQTWLVSDGMDPSRIRFSKDRAYMHLNVSVAEAERLLAAEYYVYQHPESGTEHVACHHGYHLPEHVVPHVDLVTPTVDFGGIRLGAQLSKRSTAARARGGARAPGASNMQRPHGPQRVQIAAEALAADVSSCDSQVTLDCIRALYGFSPNLQATDQNSVGIVELADQTLDHDDLQQFFQKFASDLVGTNPTDISIDGGQTESSATDPNLIGESNLDFQLMMGLLGKEQEVRLYQVGGSGSFNLLLDALDGGFCSADGGDDPDFDFVDDGTTEDCGNKPQSFVYSLSYAGAEDFPPAYMTRQCNEYGKLGLLGMTFLFASGDNGVASNGDNLCILNDGTVAVGSGSFLPNFPATCPYVTAVGATQVDPGKQVTDVESATSQFGSGGGFSNVFPRPAYQNTQVANFVDFFVPNDLGGDGVFNATGRGVPDVAANGFPTLIVVDGQYTLSGGTSASTPIFAALVVAVNDARLAAGKSPVGFMNPALYSNLFVSAFNDVVSGSNPGCGTDGFSCAPGWDPVTGLGTPRFEDLVSRFLMLP